MNQTNTTQRYKPRDHRPHRWSRYYYSCLAFVMLLIMFAGFYPYYLRGRGMGERIISSDISTLVLIHGGALTAWLILFFVQSSLIPARRIRLHMKLGWLAVGVAIVASISGFQVAVESVRKAPDAIFWGMADRQFLMVMFSEVALFTLLVIVGVLLRKRREAHRAMMLLASLSILAGATVRMPILFPVFGEAGWLGIFGPIFTLGALFLLVRSLFDKVLDRWLAAGYAVMVVVYIGACYFAVSDAWTEMSRVILKA